MPKTRRAQYNLQRRRFIYTLVSISLSTSAVAQDSDSLDCDAFSYEGVTYDLKSLASERTLTRQRETPPSTMEDSLQFNICQDLARKEVAEIDQCPTGTRACLIETNKKEGLDGRVTAVIPLAQTSVLKPSYTTLHSPDGLSIQLHGSPYPPNSSPVPQSFNLTLLCTQDGNSELTFVSYVNGIASVEWKTSAGCRKSNEGDGNNEGGGEDEEKSPDEGASSSGSGVGWFFLLLLISFLGYFAVGAYYNYNNFGATGWDLVPHRDFWRDVPYLLRDFTEHLCSTLRPGRQGASRRGYIAV